MAGAVAICNGSEQGCGIHGTRTAASAERAIDELQSMIGWTCPFCHGDVLFVGDEDATARDLEQFTAGDIEAW